MAAFFVVPMSFDGLRFVIHAHYLSFRHWGDTLFALKTTLFLCITWMSVCIFIKKFHTLRTIYTTSKSENQEGKYFCHGQTRTGKQKLRGEEVKKKVRVNGMMNDE
jgi:hypothetical protein